ncbi:MAG: AzlC family ABC transporter permease [Spirochaetales bacterium]|nr:AzlC family ABC transporter permease [Spirochaetales bacterium]
MVKKGIKDGIPVLVGYFTTAVAFGLMGRNGELLFLETLTVSLFVFAGASQFIFLSLIATGAGGLEIVITTFLVNLRHMLMSASLAVRLEKKSLLLPFAAFGVTDETFAVASFGADRITEKYLLGLNTTAYIGWIGGTAAGYLAGNLLPEKLQNIMGILLYLLFVAILTPEVKKRASLLPVILLSGGANWLLTLAGWMGSGWNMIAAIILGCTGGYLWEKYLDHQPEKEEIP